MIKTAREKKNLTQEELCKKIGITQGYYSKLENRVFTDPSSKILKKLSKALNINLKDLISWFLYN